VTTDKTILPRDAFHEVGFDLDDCHGPDGGGGGGGGVQAFTTTTA